jgi:hypothetical protein
MSAKHTHVICGRPIHAAFYTSAPTPQVACADNYCHVNSQIAHLAYTIGDVLCSQWINAKSAIAGKRLSA